MIATFGWFIDEGGGALFILFVILIGGMMYRLLRTLWIPRCPETGEEVDRCWCDDHAFVQKER